MLIICWHKHLSWFLKIPAWFDNSHDFFLANCHSEIVFWGNPKKFVEYNGQRCQLFASIHSSMLNHKLDKLGRMCTKLLDQKFSELLQGKMISKPSDFPEFVNKLSWFIESLLNKVLFVAGVCWFNPAYVLVEVFFLSLC